MGRVQRFRAMKPLWKTSLDAAFFGVLAGGLIVSSMIIFQACVELFE